MISEAEYKALKMLNDGWTTARQDEITLNLSKNGLAFWADDVIISRVPILGITPAGKQAIIDYENARKEGIEAVYREMYK